jgi:hypothetical protein
MTNAPTQATPVLAPYMKAPSNGLATASLVLGIVGTVLALIPILGIVGAIVGGVGFVLATFGLLAAKKHGVGKGKAIAGLVLGAASVIVFVAISAATVAAVDTAVDEFDKSVKDATDTSQATDLSDKDEIADATVGKPSVDRMFDTVEVDVTLTNSSGNRSDYNATVVFESPDGKKQYGTSYLFVEGLEPGQTKVETVMMLESLPKNVNKLSVRLTDFDRSESF